MSNTRGCYTISRERGSGWLTMAIAGARADGHELQLSQDDEHIWWAYSEKIQAYIPFAPSAELAGDLIALECEFRANELIGWEYRPHAFPSLATAGSRRASQARVAELQRQQCQRRDPDEQLAENGTGRLVGGLG